MKSFIATVVLACSAVAAGAADIPEQDRLLQTGRELMRNGRPAKAISDAFDKVIGHFEAQYAGSSQKVYCIRTPTEALLYMATAASAGQDAVAIAPTWSDAYYMKAFALIDLGRIADAERALESALALSPSNSQYLAEMGYILQLKREYESSLAKYSEAEEAAGTYSPPEQEKAETGRALRGQGYALIELGRLDEAEALYRRSLATDPDDRVSENELRYIEQARASAGQDH